jgi:integrase
MLSLLPEPAATVAATAAFTGARKGEIRGLLWENYDGNEIWITNSVWRSQVEEPKRPRSRAALPIISQLKTLLGRHRMRCGNPNTGFMFVGASGKPMNLEALARDVIRPRMAEAGLAWHGWHAFRRGLATNLHRLGISGPHGCRCVTAHGLDIDVHGRRDIGMTQNLLDHLVRCGGWIWNPSYILQTRNLLI